MSGLQFEFTPRVERGRCSEFTYKFEEKTQEREHKYADIAYQTYDRMIYKSHTVSTNDETFWEHEM